LPAGTFYGETEGRCHVSGFTFVECTYTAKSQLHIPVHSHESAFLCLVVAGVCDEVCDGKTTTALPFTVMFHPAGEPHADRWHGVGSRSFHVDISKARALAIGEYAPMLKSRTGSSDSMASCLARRLYAEYEVRDNVSLLAMEGLVLEIL